MRALRRPGGWVPAHVPPGRHPQDERYPDGRDHPTPSAIDFKPGELLGCVSGELGLRKFLEDAGHELVVTSDKDGEDSELEKNLPDAEVVIYSPSGPPT